MKLSCYFLIFIILISEAFADERVYVCKPLYASVLMENGHLYSESIDNMDEEAGLLSVVPVSNLSIRPTGIFYRNNPIRDYELLRSYDEIVSNKDFSPKIKNIIDGIELEALELDTELGIKNIKTYYLPYLNYNEEGVLQSSSIKRISINLQNNYTSEITVPSQAIEGVNLYYFLRKCDGDSIKVDFDEAPGKKLT